MRSIARRSHRLIARVPSPLRLHPLIACLATVCLWLSVAAAAYAQTTPGCTDSSNTCEIAAANTYLVALVSHNASQVWLASNAIRTENGIDTGDSGSDIANSLQTNPQFLLIKDIRDVRWFVSGNDVIALYLIDSQLPPAGLQVATVHIAEHFQIQQGLITQIEAFYCTHPDPTPETERETSGIELFSEQCFGANVLPGA